MPKPKDAVAQITPYTPPTAHRKDMLRLDFNENTRTCSKQAISALRNLNPEDISTYPDYTGLAQKIAAYVGFNINAAQVMLTCGSDEAIKCIMDTYIEPGDEVIIPTPTFALFELYARICTKNIIKVPYTQDMKFPKQGIISAISKKTKLIVIVNPNNPTGTIATKKDITEIAKSAKNAVILIDEAYFEYSKTTAANLISKYENIMITRTFSKAFGLAGLRIGYAISCKKNISTLQKVRSPYSINTAACAAARAALTDLSFVDNYVRETNKSKKQLISSLRKLGIKSYPSKANFVLAEFGPSAAYIWQELFKRNILTRKWKNKQYLRITAGTCAETKTALKALDSILSKKEAFIFDADGVLIDVSRSYRLAIKKTAEYFLKTTIPQESIQNLKNTTRLNNDWDLCEKIIQNNAKRIPKKKIIKKFQQYYAKYKKNETPLISKPTISKLQKKYRLAIFTGRPKNELLFTLKKFRMEKYFPVIIAMEDTEKPKPSPDGLIKALRQLGCKKGYYAGDTPDDMTAAKKAGLKPIGILPPQDKSLALKNTLTQNSARFVLDNINKICEIKEVI